MLLDPSNEEYNVEEQVKLLKEIYKHNELSNIRIMRLINQT